jgi:hypothetical protein
VTLTIKMFFVPMWLALLTSLSGCAFGTVSKIYATSGSDISLTEVHRADTGTQHCEYHKEAMLFIELAQKAATAVDGAVRQTAGMEQREEEPEPACVAFKIHERVWFSAAESINVQKYLREEFGSGREFQNIVIETKIDLLDLALNIGTLGIANSRTIEFSGEMHYRSQ